MEDVKTSINPAASDFPIKEPRVIIESGQDGFLRMFQDHPVPQAARSIAHLFLERASEYPDHTFVARRRKIEAGWGDWDKLTYATARDKAKALAQVMLDLGAGPDASVLVLSGPSINHAISILASMFVRAPMTATPTAYSLVARDFAKVDYVRSLTKPRIIVADGGEEYAAVLRSFPREQVKIISAEPITGIETTLFDDIWDTPVTPDIDASIERIQPDTVTRYVFTSGSTGLPKGVIHTQKTLCAQIAARNGLLADPLSEKGAIRLSWMPWNHIGAIIHLGYVIEDAGTYYIDEGRPIPGQFDETLRNLQDVIPLEFNSVPVLYGHLAAALEKDGDLRRRFFRTVKYLSYGSASLSDDIVERMQAMAIAETGRRVPFCTKFGTSEVQAVTHSARPMEKAGELGIPYPGVVVKLVPSGGKLEMLIKGDMVSPGYLGGPDMNKDVFDEEGFYRTGDAARFVDEDRPELGLIFDGRVTENFKLSSGTWVSVGNLRLQLIEVLAPIIHDCVIAGHDRNAIGVLVWLRQDDATAFAGIHALTPMDALARHKKIRAHIHEKVAVHNAEAKGSSLRVSRVLILLEPPSGDELAEKGYINQRATLTKRDGKVKELFADVPGNAVILIE